MSSEAAQPAPAPAATPPVQEGSAPAPIMRILRVFLYQRELTPILILIGTFIFFGFDVGWSTFMSGASLSSAAGFAGPWAAIGVAQVLLLVLGEIDLSAGQMFLFCPWVEFWLHSSGVPLVPSILIALFVVCIAGAINGLITVLLNVPSFVATLAMNFILDGVVLVGSHEAAASPIPLSGGSDFISGAMGNSKYAEIIWVMVITGVLAFVLTQTRFGTRIVATGGNLMGAAEAGVPIKRVKVWAFVISAFVAGLVGIADAVKNGTLDPGNDGVSYILYAVGACVIGGTALTGGRGTIVGAFIGAILLGVLEDGLTIAGISTDDFYIYVGIVIVGAMAINVQFDRIAARARAK